MYPAPAAKTAARVASSASAGTNQTSFTRPGLTTLTALLVVDLGSLQAARVVDVDRLPLGEHVERGLARLAVAVSGVLRTAEREVHLGAGRAGVDVGDPRLEVAHRAKRPIDVAGEDRRRQAVLDPVRDRDRLVEAAHADQRRRRAEDLLLRDAHAQLDAGKDRRTVVEALREVALGCRLAAGEEPRAPPPAPPPVPV